MKALKVLTEAEAAQRGVLAPTMEKGEPVIVGETGVKEPMYLCGECNSLLIQGVHIADVASRLQNAAIKCNGCGAINDLAVFQPN